MSSMKMILLLLAGTCELLALAVAFGFSGRMNEPRWSWPTFFALFVTGIVLTGAACLVVS